jgi:hypothetical protein
MLSVTYKPFILSIIMLNVGILSVAGPIKQFGLFCSQSNLINPFYKYITLMGAATLDIMVLSIMTHSIMALSII